MHKIQFLCAVRDFLKTIEIFKCFAGNSFRFPFVLQGSKVLYPLSFMLLVKKDQHQIKVKYQGFVINYLNKILQPYG